MVQESFHSLTVSECLLLVVWSSLFMLCCLVGLPVCLSVCLSAFLYVCLSLSLSPSLYLPLSSLLFSFPISLAFSRFLICLFLSLSFLFSLSLNSSVCNDEISTCINCLRLWPFQSTVIILNN